MSSNTWIEFRAELFGRIDERRSKISIFRFEQEFLFIYRCSKWFESPGTKEAQDAVDEILDEGTFLLVANSGRDFLAMLPGQEVLGDVPLEPDSNTTSHGKEQKLGPSTDTHLHQRAPGAPVHTRPLGTVQGQAQVSQSSQPKSDARRGSGHPFRS